MNGRQGMSGSFASVDFSPSFPQLHNKNIFLETQLKDIAPVTAPVSEPQMNLIAADVSQEA